MSAKRLSLGLIVVIGLVLATFPFATHLFSKTDGTEQLTGDLRTTFTDHSLHQTRQDLDGVVAMADELQAKALPALAAALGMSNQDFQAFLDDNYPSVAAGVEELGTILPRLELLVSGLESEQSDFEKADAIPSGFLPSTVLPWLLLCVGILLAGLGALALVRGAAGTKHATLALVGSVAVGTVLVATAIGLSIHAKGAAVDDLTSNLHPFFTASGAAKTRADMDAVQAMADELQADALPGLADALGMSSGEFGDFLEANFPDVAAGVARLDTVLPRFQADVDTISANVDSFGKTADIPTAGMPAVTLFWWLLLPGLALIGIPLLAMGAEWRERAISAAHRGASPHPDGSPV